MACELDLCQDQIYSFHILYVCFLLGSVIDFPFTVLADSYRLQLNSLIAPFRSFYVYISPQLRSSQALTLTRRVAPTMVEESMSVIAPLLP